MAQYSIRPIPICKAPFDKGLMTYRMNYGQRTEVSVYIWYIEGSEPKIIVNTGAEADMYLAHGYSKAKNIQTVEEGLSKLKLRPEDIDIVILTHLHWDHVAFASKFAKAKFIVQKAELDFALNPHPANAAPYDAGLLEGCSAAHYWLFQRPLGKRPGQGAGRAAVPATSYSRSAADQHTG